MKKRRIGMLCFCLSLALLLAGCTYNSFEVNQRRYDIVNRDHSTITATLGVEKQGDEATDVPNVTNQSVDAEKIAKAVSGSIAEIVKKFLEKYFGGQISLSELPAFIARQMQAQPVLIAAPEGRAG